MLSLVILLLIIILYLLYRYSSVNENYENIKLDIGNMLCTYYCNLVISILKKEDFHYSNEGYVSDATHVSNKSPFLDNLPKFIKFNENTYNQFVNNDISIDDIDQTGFGFWLVTSRKYEIIHKIMKPTMHSILNDLFTKLNLIKNVPYPVIHFRCADTPFVRLELYYFQRYEYFLKAMSYIENELGIVTDITILACFDHLSNEDNKKSCNRYVNLLKEKLNYNVHIECNSNVDDFATLFYAPAVISTLSSFSFMAGYFGNGIYIQPRQMVSENEKCNDCENTFSNYNIPHNKVTDYHDVDAVYKLLNS